MATLPCATDFACEEVVPDTIRPSPKSPSRQDRSAEYAKTKARINAIRQAFRTGTYVLGSWSTEGTCKACSVVYPDWYNRSKGFCSRKCAGLDKGIDPRIRRRKNNRRAKEKAKAKRLEVLKIPVQCRRCTSMFERKRNNQLYCLDCASSGVVNTRPCAYCGQLHAIRHARFCSTKCKKTARIESRTRSRQAWRKRYGKKWRRRCRVLGLQYEPVNRTLVFERDRWRCQICGTKTPASLIGTSRDREPTLDHRIPLSRGGHHLYSNVQCACRKCNTLKSNTVIIGQLPLFERPIPIQL